MPSVAVAAPTTISPAALPKGLGEATSRHETDVCSESPVKEMAEHDGAQGDTDNDIILPHLPLSKQRRPVSAPRASTDPSPATLAQTHWTTAATTTTTARPAPPTSPLSRSHYSRSHLRSRSSGTALSVPLARAHSSPGFSTTVRAFELPSTSAGYLSPVSPMRSPVRQRSPCRAPEEQSHNPAPRPPVWYDTSTTGNAIESIEEDRELELTPRQKQQQPQPHPSPASMSAQFGRSSSLRRRPASPLHSGTVSAMASISYPGEHHVSLSTSVASSGSNSPSLGPQRYNEAYPPLHHYASSSSFSSIPSTPTSQRSRSPSISSLDTIEDAPDLESEAIEAERIERLKMAAEREERADSGEEPDDSRRRSSLEVPRGFGFARGGNRERKRWSVCGGERRADLDLETIWED